MSIINKKTVSKMKNTIISNYGFNVEDIEKYKDDFIKESIRMNRKYKIFNNPINKGFIIESDVDNFYMNVLTFDPNNQ